MRYELDVDGYILATYFGCYSGTGKCKEYTGEVPYGYTDLNKWSENALINAYYINDSGNLALDSEREVELQEKAMQETIDNTPLFHKDLYGTNEILDSQYQNESTSGEVLILNNVKKIAPRVKLTNIKCYDYSTIDIFTHGNNMLKNDGKTETIEGVSFTKNPDGSIRINGTATADIEYNLSGSSTNASPIFVLKKFLSYYLNIGNFNCEMKYFDGETTAQVYIGASGVISLSESKKVTQVLLKIPSGTAVNTTIYPMLNYGATAKTYESYKSKILSIDFSDRVEETLFPSDTLYPSNDLFPMGTTIDYILIENRTIYIFKDGALRPLCVGNVQLFDGDNTVYASEDVGIEMTYSINELVLEGIVKAEIKKAEDSITSSVSRTYATKDENNNTLNSAKGYTDAQVTTAKSEIKLTTDSISLEVNKKVNNEDFTGANILLEINNDQSEAQINANKINLNGKEIDLTSDNMTIKSNNFNVDKSGNMTCSNATISNGKITINTDQVGEEVFRVVNNNGYEVEISSGRMWMHAPNFKSAIYLQSASDEGVIQLSSKDNATGTYLAGNMITTHYLAVYGEAEAEKFTQTSKESKKKNITKYNEKALEIVKNSEIYEYNFKSENDNDKKHIGFVIGDEGGKYKTPEQVISNNREGIENYSMTSILWKAMQEQQQLIEQLQKEIEKLKKESE